MKGHYKIFQDDVLVGAADNLLTSAARRSLLRFLAGESQSWAGSIAIGAIDTPPLESDRRLAFEIGRGQVSVKAADVLNNAVVVKATIPRAVVGSIYEVGLYTSVNQTAREGDQMLISDFNSEVHDTENVTPGRLRVGRVSSVIQGDTTARFKEIGVDISTIGTDDRIVLAYESTGVDVEIRFKNDAANYVYYQFTAANGYNSEEWTINDFVSVGTGTILEPFNEIEVVVTGPGELELDGLRIDDSNVFDDQVLISRALLATPIEKNNSSDMDIEYSISFEF